MGVGWSIGFGIRHLHRPPASLHMHAVLCGRSAVSLGRSHTNPASSTSQDSSLAFMAFILVTSGMTVRPLPPLSCHTLFMSTPLPLCRHMCLSSLQAHVSFGMPLFYTFV